MHEFFLFNVLNSFLYNFFSIFLFFSPSGTLVSWGVGYLRLIVKFYYFLSYVFHLFGFYILRNFVNFIYFTPSFILVVWLLTGDLEMDRKQENFEITLERPSGIPWNNREKTWTPNLIKSTDITTTIEDIREVKTH